jgi:hypothetical protein
MKKNTTSTAAPAAPPAPTTGNRFAEHLTPFTTSEITPEVVASIAFYPSPDDVAAAFGAWPKAEQDALMNALMRRLDDRDASGFSKLPLATCKFMQRLMDARNAHLGRKGEIYV